MPMTPNKSEARPKPSPPAAVKTPDIASLSVPDTLVALKVNPDAGLEPTEVERTNIPW